MNVVDMDDSITEIKKNSQRRITKLL